VIKNNPEDKVPHGTQRSPRWKAMRKHYLTEHPTCAVCGGTWKLEVHHIKPFHTHPRLELDPDNLITLCEAKTNGVSCHLLFGHLGNFKSINLNVVADVKTWHQKIKTRP
jgi:5-methylcytosine-specific restriction protein A